MQRGTCLTCVGEARGGRALDLRNECCDRSLGLCSSPGRLLRHLSWECVDEIPLHIRASWGYATCFVVAAHDGIESGDSQVGAFQLGNLGHRPGETSQNAFSGLGSLVGSAHDAPPAVEAVELVCGHRVTVRFIEDGGVQPPPTTCRPT